MKILIICKRFYTNKDLLADRFGRLYHLPRIWSRKHDIKVLALNYYRVPDAELLHEPFSLRSVPCTTLPLGLIPAYSQCKRQAVEFSPDIVISSGDIITAVFGYNIARSTDTNWFYDIYDDYRYFKLNRITLLSKLFPFFCRNAAGLLVASKELYEICKQWNRKVQIIPNGYDPEIFNNQPLKIARTRLGLDSNLKLVAFTGSVDDRFDTELIKASFSELYEEDKTIRLVHAGSTSNTDWPNQPWLINLGPLSQKSVVDVINASNACIAPYKSNELSETCNPCKISEYLACNKPVIASDITPLYEYLKFGVNLYKAGSKASLLNSIRKELSEPSNTITDNSLTWEVIAENAEIFLTNHQKIPNPN